MQLLAVIWIPSIKLEGGVPNHGDLGIPCLPPYNHGDRWEEEGGFAPCWPGEVVCAVACTPKVVAYDGVCQSRSCYVGVILGKGSLPCREAVFILDLSSYL